MIQHRNHKGLLRIRNTPYGREVVFEPKDDPEYQYRRRFINKKEAAEFFEKCKTEMEK